MRVQISIGSHPKSRNLFLKFKRRLFGFNAAHAVWWTVRSTWIKASLWKEVGFLKTQKKLRKIERKSIIWMLFCDRTLERDYLSVRHVSEQHNVILDWIMMYLQYVTVWFQRFVLQQDKLPRPFVIFWAHPPFFQDLFLALLSGSYISNHISFACSHLSILCHISTLWIPLLASVCGE
jgi:hypothetical protein